MSQMKPLKESMPVAVAATYVLRSSSTCWSSPLCGSVISLLIVSSHPYMQSLRGVIKALLFFSVERALMQGGKDDTLGCPGGAQHASPFLQTARSLYRGCQTFEALI
jgi:hypothetical protein